MAAGHYPDCRVFDCFVGLEEIRLEAAFTGVGRAERENNIRIRQN
jgi:hypothetical protein